MVSTSVIILEYVCPGLGVLVAGYLFFAPVNDCYLAVKAGKGLGDLNPTPWAFCLGNCIGWIIYGILKQNIFILVGNSPGLLISVWLNMQAAKLEYEAFRSKAMLSTLVNALEEPINSGQSSSTATKEDHLVEPETAPLSGESITRAIAIVRATEAQNMSAPYSHDTLVLINVIVWLVVISIVCYGSALSDQVKEYMVGVIVNLNLVIFYASPLSVIWTVLSARSSAAIHIPTMIGVTLNGLFWAAYGIAVLDAIIAVPNALGALLGFVQIILCVTFPRKSKESATIQGVSEQLPAQPASSPQLIHEEAQP